MIHLFHFRAFVPELDPTFQLPVKKTIRKYLDIEYQEKKETVRNLLSQQPSVALTTDIWSSRARQGYITVTSHFIDEKWNMRRGVLATHYMPESHTGENIAKRILEFLIKEVAGISHDNAANMKLAARQLDVPSTLCFGHTLQLAIQEGLSHPTTTECLKSCKALIMHFNQRPLATTALKTRPGELTRDGIDFPKLQQDVPMRWNSTYFMIQSLLKNKGPIGLVLGDREVTKAVLATKLELRKEDWQLLEQIVECLRPFDVATKQMSAELYPTLGSVYPLVRGIMKRHLKKGEEEEREVAFFKSKVKKALRKRFNIGEEDFCDDIIASVLHPRFKKLKFLEHEETEDTDEEDHEMDEQQERLLRREDAKLRVITKLKELVSIIDVSTTPTTARSDSEVAAKDVSTPETTARSDSEVVDILKGVKVKKEQLESSDTAMKYLMGDCFEISDDEEETAHEEVDRYMADLEDKKLTTLDWWRKHELRYPRIAVIARKMLGRPATSVPSERLFSIGGKLVTADRACLHPDTVDQLLFLNSYLKIREGTFAMGNQETPVVNEKMFNIREVKVEPELPSLDMDTN